MFYTHMFSMYITLIQHVYTCTCTCTGSEIPGFVHKVMRKRPKSSNKENQRQPSKEGCRKRLNYGSAIITNGGNLSEGGKERVFTNRPPLSYASLIVLAISSTPQMMLTLSGIYRWIESTLNFLSIEHLNLKLGRSVYMYIVYVRVICIYSGTFPIWIYTMKQMKVS